MTIFISYKRLDKADVFPIVEKIKQETGINCWIDLEGIESGDQFENVIMEAIENADIVVCMLSRNFIAPYKDEKTGRIDDKKPTYPRREVNYALDNNKRLVSISIDGTTIRDWKWLHFKCGSVDYTDWNNIDSRKKLFRDLKQWESKQSDERSAIVRSYPSKSGPVTMEHHPELVKEKQSHLKEVYLISLVSPGPAKLQVVKGVKEFLGLGLKEAKDIVDTTPSELPGLYPLNDANRIKKLLEEVGAKVKIVLRYV